MLHSKLEFLIIVSTYIADISAFSKFLTICFNCYIYSRVTYMKSSCQFSTRSAYSMFGISSFARTFINTLHRTHFSILAVCFRNILIWKNVYNFIIGQLSNNLKNTFAGIQFVRHFDKIFDTIVYYNTKTTSQQIILNSAKLFETHNRILIPVRKLSELLEIYY